MGFKKNIKEIKRLNELDPATVTERLSKIFEEVGEMAQAVNKTNGRKYLKKGETVKKILKNIGEEGVDAIQCIFSLLTQLGFSDDDMIRIMKKKNKSWEKAIRKKNRTVRHAKQSDGK